MDEELKSYVEETKDAYDRVEEILAHLQDNPTDTDSLNALFRDFHSIKGVSGFFSFKTTEAICHASEDAMSHVSHNNFPMDDTIIQVLYEAVDVLRGVLESIATTGAEKEVDYSELLLKLSSIEMMGKEDESETKIVETPEEKTEVVEEKAPEPAEPTTAEDTELFQLLYMSTSKWKMDTKELIHLLCEARDNNRKQDVTGMLIYRDQFFMQTLEGPKDRVLGIMDKIKGDKRHHNVVILGQGEIEARTFPNWSMGFQYMNVLKRMNIDGLNDAVTENKWPEQLSEGIGFAYRLMKSFSENAEVL